MFADVVNGKRAKRNEVLIAFDTDDLDVVCQFFADALLPSNSPPAGSESYTQQGRVSAERGRARAGARGHVP